MYKKLYLFFIILFFSIDLNAINVDQTIESTVKNNPKVKIGIEKLIESKELIENATGSLLPTITSTLSGTYANSETNTSTADPTTSQTFTDKYKLSITQNIYDAGINNLEIERSKILFDNEIINFRITLKNLILDAITGYLTVISYEKSLEATNKNFEFINKALEETKTKYELGASTLYELQKSQSSYAIANANLFAAEQNVNISKKSFKRIVGLEALDLDDFVKIDMNLNFDSIINKALLENENLTLLYNDIKNKEILLLKEKMSKKPNLDLTGSAEYSDAGRLDSGTETTKGSISLTLTIPLYKQGKDDSDIRKYESQILQSQMNYEDFKEDLQIQISNFLKDFRISEANMNSNLSLIKASETALKSLKQEYDIGTKSINNLIEEERNLLTANVDYINSKKDYLVNYFKIKSLEGSLLDYFDKYLPQIN